MLRLANRQLACKHKFHTTICLALQASGARYHKMAAQSLHYGRVHTAVFWQGQSAAAYMGMVTHRDVLYKQGRVA